MQRISPEDSTRRASRVTSRYGWVVVAVCFNLNPVHTSISVERVYRKISSFRQTRKSKQTEHIQFVSTLSKGRNFVRHCCQKRQQCRSHIRLSRKKIVRFVAFDNVALTLLLVWTGLYTLFTDFIKEVVRQCPMNWLRELVVSIRVMWFSGWRLRHTGCRCTQLYRRRDLEHAGGHGVRSCWSSSQWWRCLSGSSCFPPGTCAARTSTTTSKPSTPTLPLSRRRAGHGVQPRSACHRKLTAQDDASISLSTQTTISGGKWWCFWTISVEHQLSNTSCFVQTSEKYTRTERCVATKLSSDTAVSSVGSDITYRDPAPISEIQSPIVFATRIRCVSATQEFTKFISAGTCSVGPVPLLPLSSTPNLITSILSTINSLSLNGPVSSRSATLLFVSTSFRRMCLHNNWVTKWRDHWSSSSHALVPWPCLVTLQGQGHGLKFTVTGWTVFF